MRRLALVPVVLTVVAAALSAAQSRKVLTLDLVVEPETIVSPGIRETHWRPGHSEITYLRKRGAGQGAASALCIYDVERGTEHVLLDSREVRFSLDSYQWSPRGDALLLSGDSDLWLYDVMSGAKRRLTDDSEEKDNATFSPAADRIAFVKANDIFTIELNSGLLKRLTSDGSGTVLNGKLDWVYEEEITNRATRRSYEWSPDGKKIVYLRLDDAPVPEYPLTDYLDAHVRLILQRFPQAGDPNPEPSVQVAAVEEGKSERWTLPLDRRAAEYVSPWFAWTPDSTSVAVLTLNRAQDEQSLRLWNPVTGDARTLLSEKDATWVNSLDPPAFLPDGKGFLWLSERDGWMHLYLYSMDGRLERSLGQGNWMLDRPFFTSLPIFQLDASSGWIYTMSTEPDPRERHVYRVRIDGTGKERLTRDPGSHSLDLSPDGRYLLDGFSNSVTPPETRLLRADGSLMRVIDEPENHLAEYALAKTDLVEVKAPDGAMLYARLVKPPDFDPRKKYPVIVDVYGGPHVQLVQNEWGLTGWFERFLAQEGYLVWSLDGRGSWGRGHAWESVVFKNLGQHELQDQLAGVTYLKSLPYVDPVRIGIFGWSYGGYMTLFALTHAPGVFKCGVAGAPVTGWKFYDSIYTERYMRTPGENPEGYKTASPLSAAAQVQDKLLIIHGTDDDNVHMQNSMNFMAALVMAGRPFDLYIQPGQKHGFDGKPVRAFLYRRVLDFFRQNL
jgi:dipeptidyl-peptidase-4